MMATLKRWALAWIYAAGRYGEYGWIVQEAEREQEEAERILREVTDALNEAIVLVPTTAGVEAILHHLGYTYATVEPDPNDPTVFIIRRSPREIVGTAMVR